MVPHSRAASSLRGWSVGPTWQTTVPGVYAVGDVATPMQQIAMAVSSGAMAGALANHALVMDDLG